MYGLSANNSILFEKTKTGTNPEKANLHKKRLLIFKEPAEQSKFENSVVKELTGGGKFSARTHHEKSTEKILHNTTICECNKRPLFAEEPNHAEVERIIDIAFRSTFTTDKSELDDKAYIFEGKQEYKEKQFQHDHKMALLHILMNVHKEYSDNGCKFDIPESIKKRTSEYLEMSCNLLQWFKTTYELSDDDDIIKIKDIYEEFKENEYYSTLSKFEKRKYNYKYFTEYFSNNIVTRKYYKERYTKGRTGNYNVLYSWKQIQKEIKNDNMFIDDENSEDTQKPESKSVNILDL
jgi:phage/plasmid-associated DNA primase